MLPWGGGDPLTPSGSGDSTQRNGMAFDVTHHLFGDVANGVTASDSDVATVLTRESFGYGWEFKQPFESLLTQRGWCVATSVLRTGTLDAPQYALAVCFMPADGINFWYPLDPQGRPRYQYTIVTWVLNTDEHHREIANPRIAAITKIINNNLTDIEVTVILQTRLDANNPSSLWDLALWKGEYTLDGQYPARWAGTTPGFVNPNPFFDISGNQINPDLAYDYDNGDLHITYSDSTIDWVSQCMWNKWTKTTDTWGTATIISDTTYNGWTPRIDVGYVYPFLGLPYDDEIVGVVYTAQQPHDNSGGQYPWVDSGLMQSGDLYLVVRLVLTQLGLAIRITNLLE